MKYKPVFSPKDSSIEICLDTDVGVVVVIFIHWIISIRCKAVYVEFSWGSREVVDNLRIFSLAMELSVRIHLSILLRMKFHFILFYFIPMPPSNATDFRKISNGLFESVI